MLECLFSVLLFYVLMLLNIEHVILYFNHANDIKAMMMFQLSGSWLNIKEDTTRGGPP